MGQLSTVVAALLSALAVCGGAPTATIIQPAHYYLIQPQPSTLKIQPHLIQPIQHLKLEPKQYVYYYPAGLPLAATTTTTTHHQYTEGKPIRLTALKQEEGGNGNWWSSVFGFFQPPTTEMPAGEGETTEAPAAASSAPEKKLMYVAPGGALDLRVGETPASTSGLPQRYYILSGAPQFYGNFDALQNPLSPIFSLQPLQAIHARANSDIQAEDEQPKFQAQIVSSLAPIAPVPAAVPAQLKNDLLESHQDKEQTIDRTWGRSLDDEQPQQQQPEPQPLAEDEPVIVQARSKGDEEEGESGVMRVVYDEEQPKQEPEQAMQRSVNDPAIAAAKPSGNFFEDEDEEKKKM
ncbi:uncharacterized protein LOC128277945 isoform X2 [Anopheles cruzii]|uniref:uncharacterized protein LOC128277945 isoform X2 n=1 Tax=Anopheles cruzii TaxID=68878 RepID=UPI0022EC8FDE|nr:uncharacterized protein LOC128277945 isoform X2 [Anopheles cruzii]